MQKTLNSLPRKEYWSCLDTQHLLLSWTQALSPQSNSHLPSLSNIYWSNMFFNWRTTKEKDHTTTLKKSEIFYRQHKFNACTYAKLILKKGHHVLHCFNYTRINKKNTIKLEKETEKQALFLSPLQK